MRLKLFARWFCAALSIAAPACRAQDELPKPDAQLEIVHYKGPAGWRTTNQASAHVLVAPDSNGLQQAMILIVLKPAQDALDLRTAFDAAVKDVTSEGKAIEAGDVASTKTRQGFDAVARTLVIQNPGDQRVYARMIAANVHNRMAGIYYLATSQELYDKHQAEMGALLKSVSFDDDGAGAAVDPQKQLAVARTKFAVDVAGRRKPHTIAGDFATIDGKPIPDVAAYRVFVWGTTIAAERARYGIEVDANGHFEQQVPDGLYQIKATCVVNHAGRRVPVDLVWLDDKKSGVDQASAAGIVRDFRVMTSGLKPGEDPKRPESFFGGRLTVTGPPYDVTRGTMGTRYKGGKVIVTMTPVGPLVDGSRRDLQPIEFGASDVDYGGKAWSIPLGAYRATAVVIGADGSKKELLCSRSFDGEFTQAVDVYWESSKDDPEDRTDPIIYLRD